MKTEEKLTAEEVGQRITAGMGLVYDLFKELNSLFRLIAAGLRDSEADIQLMGPKAFVLPRAKKGTGVADQYVCTDMGLLAEIGGTPSDEPDDNPDVEEETDDADVETDNTVVSITPDSQYLCIRAVLYNPDVPTEKFVPSLIAVVLSSLVRQTKGKKKGAGEGGTQTAFKLRRPALKKLVKQLDCSLKPDQRIAARIVGSELTAEVTAVEIVPLGDFTSEQRVSLFVDSLLKMVEGS